MYMFVYVNVCVYVCIYVCVCMYMCVYVYVGPMYVCVYMSWYHVIYIKFSTYQLDIIDNGTYLNFQ